MGVALSEGMFHTRKARIASAQQQLPKWSWLYGVFGDMARFIGGHDQWITRIYAHVGECQGR